MSVPLGIPTLELLKQPPGNQRLSLLLQRPQMLSTFRPGEHRHREAYIDAEPTICNRGGREYSETSPLVHCPFTNAGGNREQSIPRGCGMTNPSLANPPSIPPELSAEIRRLMHDLSNALEIVLQAGYLLTTADTEEPVKQWIGLLDGGAQQALKVHQQLREYIRAHS
jgi:hypothetical protein